MDVYYVISAYILEFVSYFFWQIALWTGIYVEHARKKFNSTFEIEDDLKDHECELACT